jgi:hypothetical protein
MGADRFASPVARALALELGLDEVEILGTGRAGSVTLADVRSAAPSIPAGLDDAGAAFWRDVHTDWKLRPDEEQLLLAACRTIDELARLETALHAASVVVRGSKGQDRAHPLVREIREHRLALKQLLGAAGIGISESGAGAPAGERARARSDAGRQLAYMRHRGSRG